MVGRFNQRTLLGDSTHYTFEGHQCRTQPDRVGGTTINLSGALLLQQSHERLTKARRLLPNFVLQYDLTQHQSNHIDNIGYASSTVYANIGRILQSRGWTRHQYSCWRVEGKGALAAVQYDAAYVANEMEARFVGPAPGIFIHLQYEERTQFFAVQ